MLGVPIRSFDGLVPAVRARMFAIATGCKGSGELILATDTHYGPEGLAITSGILFANWTDAVPTSVFVTRTQTSASYQPGAFYKRELPCILKLLESIPHPLHAIVIDGFVTLGADQKPGLGAALRSELWPRPIIIGVAKTPFRGTPTEQELLRGNSRKPLYISCRGTQLQVAKQHIASMHGPHRLPTLLKLADTACRKPQSEV